jgi:hypothetical protein
MNSSMIYSYLKIIGGTAMVSPLFYAFLNLEPKIVDNPLKVLIITYLILWTLGIMMFNYLEYGIFWIYISKKNRKKFGD